MGHGSGGRLTAQLIRDLFLPAFGNAVLNKLDDQAVLDVNSTRIAFTTDSFVVTPLFFPGGNIGELAINGTVNDLAMSGATPLYTAMLSVSSFTPDAAKWQKALSGRNGQTVVIVIERAFFLRGDMNQGPFRAQSTFTVGP